MLTGTPEQKVLESVEEVEPIIEILGMTLHATELYTGAGVAFLAGLFGLLFWIIKRRIRRRFPLNDGCGQDDCDNCESNE